MICRGLPSKRELVALSPVLDSPGMSCCASHQQTMMLDTRAKG